MRAYQYVGPREIAERVGDVPLGHPIFSVADVVACLPHGDEVIMTFVVDLEGTLRLADRHSEHVACAGGRAVLSAGEITFEINGGEVSVIAVSNQSTGYCPEPESWLAVVNALDRAGLCRPPSWTLECLFRLCPACGQKNLIKDDVFECGICEASLPAEYNCQQGALLRHEEE